MLPNFPLPDCIYRSRANAITDCNVFTVFISTLQAKYFFCLNFFQNRSSNSFSFRNSFGVRFGAIVPSALIGHISKVVSACTKEKVIWIHARPIITLVAHTHRAFDRAVMNCPRNLVRAVPLVSCAFPVYLAISIGILSSRPHPTFSKMRNMLLNWAVFIHLAPKPLNIFFSHNKITRRPAKVLPAHGWPQLLNDGLKVLFPSVFIGRNMAAMRFAHSEENFNPI